MRGLSIDPRMQRLGFDLRGIPGLEAAWLSRFPSGLGTMALPADNTPMGTWVDLSGKGRDLTQATGANQPLWRRAGVNLLPNDVATTSAKAPFYDYWQSPTFDIDAAPVTPPVGADATLKQPVTGSVATLATRTAWWTPVVEGQLITYSVYALAGANNRNQARVVIDFMPTDKGSTPIATTYSSFTPITTSGWAHLSVTGTVPAGSAWVRIRVVVNDSVSGDVFYWAGLQLELGPTATPWLPPGNAQGMQFDGANDFMQTVPLAGWPETTVYAVATPVDMSTTGVIAMHRTTNAGWYFTFRSPDLSRVDWNNAADNGSGGGIKVGNAALQTSLMQLSGNSFYLNGVHKKSSSVPFAPASLKATSVGRGDDGGWPLNGLIHDIIICSQAHDDTTRQRVEAALARANGVTLAA